MANDPWPEGTVADGVAGDDGGTATGRGPKAMAGGRTNGSRGGMDMCIDMHIDMCRGMCVDVCVDVRIDMSTCANTCVRIYF